MHLLSCNRFSASSEKLFHVIITIVLLYLPCFFLYIFNLIFYKFLSIFRNVSIIFFAKMSLAPHFLFLNFYYFFQFWTVNVDNYVLFNQISYQLFLPFPLPSPFTFNWISFTFLCYITFTYSPTYIFICGLVLDKKINIFNSQVSPLLKFLQLSSLESQLIDQDVFMTPVFSRFLHN